ncbi:hypothetical protein F4776DRAFT_230730 [Hypoxylon sp. NC0597]|nr:hypothetical protein F4776DRAFT_230730 [Hypoxylon sp. NC0597]
MADSMCGPSNGLKGISRHFDSNRSEQHDRITSTRSGHAFSQGEYARQDEEFARFQQGTALLGGPAPINSTHGHVPSEYLTPNPNPHPMLVPMPAPGTVSNTMPNAGVQGLNIANVNQYREPPHAFMNPANSLHQAHPGLPVQAGPSSRPLTTNYPLNHHPASGITPGGMQFGYRPMPSLMAGGMPLNSLPSSLHHQQQQAANATSATDDFDFDAELSAWMERNSLQDQPNTSEKPQESAHNSLEDQAHVSKERAVDAEAKAANLANDLPQLEQNLKHHNEDRTIPNKQPQHQQRLDGLARGQATLDFALEKLRVDRLRRYARAGTTYEPTTAEVEAEASDVAKAEAFHSYYLGRDIIEETIDSLSPEDVGHMLQKQDQLLIQRLTRINRQRMEDAELASAAQRVLNAVSAEDSEKFKSSQFLNMMRKVAAMEVVVRGNDLVNPEAADPTEEKPAPDGTDETTEK